MKTLKLEKLYEKIFPIRFHRLMLFCTRRNNHPGNHLPGFNGELGRLDSVGGYSLRVDSILVHRIF
jgi:hypothetical protein